MTASYPPEFIVEAHVGFVVMTCLECSVHISAPSFTLDKLNIEAEAHTNVHLREALYDRHSG